MANAVGVKGFRVEKPQQLEAAISADQEPIMPPTTTIEEARNFGLFMMKAYLTVAPASWST